MDSVVVISRAAVAMLSLPNPVSLYPDPPTPAYAWRPNRFCSVSDNFKSYEYFYEWCNAQVGFGNEGWQLDKDLLVKGNKIYSEDTCCFLPEEVNKALTRSDKTRGSSPIGVTKRGGSYYASISIRGKTKPLGSFKSETLAFEEYCKNKEEYLSLLAVQYENQIDRRVYQKLTHYKVGIHD